MAKIRALLVVLGFILLGLFIWYAGPYFSFADYRPLDAPTVRLVVMALVVGGWAAAKLLRRLRAGRASDKLMAAVVKQSQAEKAQPSPEALQLRERFEEAVAALKQKRRGGLSLYDLPWYVIIGAPGSGKTTALVNSGLKFPIEQRSGKGALRGVGGTRNCDWWFTDEAVLLDTAGRYTTQDSDASADSAAWAEFLALLRKYRKRRPVNGVMLTISAQDLMVQGQAGRDAHVAAARRRLEELNRELRIQLPVYLLVTKCDLVAGFTEYFEDLTQDGRAQVWGVTFPYDQTLSGQASKAFAGEFDELMARLNARLFGRLEEERDPRRRTRMFAFPQQMASLREPLAQFVTDVFGSTRFDRQVLLRGVYLTSGTQEGTPIDRLLGAISRRFAVAAEAVVPAGRGKAYFIERLLKDVLFAESGLAGVNRRVELMKAAGQLGAYAALFLVAVIGVVLFSVSYQRNQAYLAAVGADVAKLQDLPPLAEPATLETVVPRLDAVRAAVDSADRYRDATPWAMRWGLFQGSAIGNAARDAYVRELDGALLPQVEARFRQRLVEYVPEPEKLFEYLKAYLMLNEPARLDTAHLGAVADEEWRNAYAASPEEAESLSRHFRSLLEIDEGLRPVAIDQSLVAQARSTIQRVSVPQLMYRRLTQSYTSDTARALRLDVAAGLGAERVLRRKSGARLAEPVPSLYTREVFKEVTGRDTGQLVALYATDSWVWGEERPTPQSAGKLAMELTDIYEKDYIRVWDGIVNDIELVAFPSLTEAKEVLATLGGATSPLRGFLKTVDDHTFLVAPPEPAKEGGLLSSAGRAVSGRFGNVFDAGRKAIGLSTVPAGTLVTQHFAPIHRLVAGEAGSAPIDRVLEQLRQIQQQLQPVGTGAGQKIDPVTQGAVAVLAQSLQREAAALPGPIAALVAEIGRRTGSLGRLEAGRDLGNAYRQDVLRECGIIAGRYPFSPASTTEVPLADFGRLFGFNGVFDTFFKDRLAQLVDTSRSPWTWRTDATGAALSAPFPLSQFEAAQRIREMFFRPGAQLPELRFRVTLDQLDAGALRFLLEIDGQSFENRHTAPRALPATWPGPQPGMAAVTFEDRSTTRPNLVTKGEWAWFRLMAEAQVRTEGDERYVFTFERGGHRAEVIVDALTVKNPYAKRDLQQFTCGS